jgi:hypothetical protein
VIVADVAVDAECNVRSVNCFTHRRYVMSFAEFFYACAPSTAPGTGTTPGLPFVTPFVSGVTNTIRMMRLMSGTTDLVDVAGAMSGDAPRAMVAVMRADGSTAMLPAFFSVERGSTVADLLEREGDRAYFDPATEQTYSLREIYRAASVSPSTRLEGTASALAPLEGKTLRGIGATPATPEGEAAPVRAGAERAHRATPTAPEAIREDAIERLRDAIDPSALERLRSEAEVADLPATSIAGVSATSALGKRLSELTIGDVAAMTRAEFIAHATRDVATRRRGDVTRQADEVWRRAQTVSGAYAPEPESETERESPGDQESNEELDEPNE